MLTVVLLLLLGSGTVQASTFTVLSGQSLTSAIRQLRPGDTLEIQPGTYTEPIDVGVIPSGSSWAAPVTLKGIGRPVIKPSRGNSQGDAVGIGQGQRYIILDGLVLDGSHVPVQALRIRDDARYIRVQNGVMTGAKQSNCMNVNDPETRDIEILNNDISGCGHSNQEHGIYVRGSHVRIEGNRIRNNSGHGVHLYYKARSVSHVLVKGNEVAGNGSWGILIGSGDGNVAVNNLVYGNGKAMGVGGIRIGYYSPRENQVLHNTVYTNAMDCVMVNSESDDATVLNNICWQNGRDQVNDFGARTAVGYTLTQNPRFMDPSQGDLRLLSDSPAIDQGKTLSQVLDDFARIVRPQSAAYDIGAYEYGSPRGPAGGLEGGIPPGFGPLPPPTALRLVK